jgi:uroporphyrinogen-III synthase
LLEARGARALTYPTIAITPVDDVAPLDAALRSLMEYDWMAFTSANSVAACASRGRTLGIRVPGALSLAAVGEATARAVAGEIRAPDLIASAARADALADALCDAGAQRVLFPRGDLARDSLPRVLRARGVPVDEVVAYRTVPGAGAEALARQLSDGNIDAVLFLSASSIENLMKGAMPVGVGKPAIVCIGPETARAARDAGLHVDAVAAERSAESIVGALEDFFATRPRQPN